MGFLLKCLQGSETLLTHYNTDIPSIIEELKSSIGKGLGVSGFAQAIEKVQEGLQGYESGMTMKSKKVQDDISTIKNAVGTLNDKFKSMRDTNLSQQLKIAKQYAALYHQKAEDAETARKALDSTLSGKLDKHVNLVVQATNGFKEIAEDEGMTQQAGEVDKQLKLQKENIDNAIKQSVSELRKTLHDGFDGILQTVGNLYTKKEEHFKVINEEIEETKAAVITLLGTSDDTFESTFKDKIIQHFERIRNATYDIHKSLRLGKSSLVGLLDQTQRAFGILKAKIGEDAARGLEDSIYRNWYKLKIEIQRLLGEIIGNKIATTGLLGVVGGVEKYSKQFGSEGLNNTLGEWVHEILKQNAVVKMWLYWYVNTNKQNKNLHPSCNTEDPDQILSEKSNTIAQLMVDQIMTHIDTGVIKSAQAEIDAVAEEDKGNKINTYHSAVYACISAFSKALEEKLTSNRIKQFVEEVVTKVDSGLTGQMFSSGSIENAKGFLTTAVEYTLIALNSTALQVVSEFHSFIDESKIYNTETALEAAEKITNQFDEDSQHGKKIDDALNNVKQQIEALTPLLNDVDQPGSMLYKLGEIQKEVIAKLDNMSNDSYDGDINRSKQEVDKIMLSLRNKIQSILDKMNDIAPVVETFNKELNHAIQSIEDALHNAEKNSERSVKQLNNQLTNTVSSVFTALTAQVQSLFAKQKQAELSALEHVVTTQLREIDRIIREDRENGLKGFLRDLQDGFDSNFYDLLSFPKLEQLSKKAKEFFEALLMYVADQVKTIAQGKQQQKADNDQSIQVENIRNNMNTLLHPLTYFDAAFVNHLEALRISVGNLVPEMFDGNNNPLLDLVRTGVGSFVKELEYAYINSYDGRRFAWVGDKDPESKQCAKAFLTTIPMVFTALKELKENIEKQGDSWRLYNMYNSRHPHSCLYGAFFRHNGYDVGRGRSIYRGELNHKNGFTGGNVLSHIIGGKEKLFSPPNNLASLSGSTRGSDDELPFDVHVEDGLVPKLYSYLKPYNQTCHLLTHPKAKQPCSVYDQLVWLSGLQFNTVFDSLVNHVQELFMVPDESNPQNKIPKPIDAHPNSFTSADINNAIQHLSEHAYLLLAGILGNGDAYTTYACEFPNNSHKFKYPTSGDECLDMLLDILKRLFPPLKFLQTQCALSAKHNGWQDCRYGRHISTPNQPCGEQPNKQPACQPNCQANTHSNCRPTSPLMSYLNDCLPGHLPHTLETIGCKSKCLTCPSNKKGMPCLTPLGFKAFSCGTRTGAELCDMIADFFDDEYCTSLFCLAPTPPVNLPEHFGFALSIAQNVNLTQTVSGRMKTFTEAFESSIKLQSVSLCEDPYELTKPIIRAYGSSTVNHRECDDYHLKNLTIDNMCMSKVNKISCAPYLTSLFYQSYDILAAKHSDVYLSWAVYLPWTLHTYLKMLLDEFSKIFCPHWGCRRCQHGTSCKPGQHGSFDSPCQCKSVVSCNGVMPTLYKCGFMFADPLTLKQGLYPQTCYNFQKMLSSVINSKYFTELFNKCDNFLFTIRAPFIWLTLALWLLSLLYLLHIMVIRLDLLHIKSHLHSPSSHRIAAQSLLAAARVNKLGRVFYLQP